MSKHDILEYFKDINFAYNSPVMFDALKDMLGELESENKAHGWISVKDRLPEKSGQYLCWFGANKVAIGMAIVTYVDEWKAFGRLKSLEKYPNITHWMPLPEPPNPAEEPAVHEVRKDVVT